MSKETNGVEETCDNCGGKDCERQIEYGEKQPCWIPIKPKDTSSAIKERIKQDLKAEQAYMDTKPCATCSGLVPSNWQPNNSLISEKELNVGIKEQAPTEIDKGGNVEKLQALAITESAKVISDLKQQVRELESNKDKLKTDMQRWIDSLDNDCKKLQAENERLQTAFSYTDKAGRVFEKQVEQLKGEVKEAVRLIRGIDEKFSIGDDPIDVELWDKQAEQFLAGK